MYPAILKHRAIFFCTKMHATLRQAAKVFGPGKSTIARWLRPSVHRQTTIPIHKSIQHIVEKCVQNDCFSTIDDILAAVNASNRKAGRTTVWRSLREARYSRKRTRMRFSPKTPSREDLEALKQCTAHGEVISVDETCVYLEKPRAYGYAPRGKRLVSRLAKPIRSNKLTLLLAISESRGVVGWKTIRGSCDTQLFAEFVRDIDAPHGAKILLDNVRFHHANETKHAASIMGFRLVYTPPYCPELNPVENAFSVLKASMSRGHQDVVTAVSAVTLTKCAAFYRESRRQLDDALRRV